MHADILIVVVTKVESQAVFDVFGKSGGHTPRPYLVGDKMYHNLGVIKGARVFMVQSEMGSGGLDASQQTVRKGIDALSPGAVIMTGVAFGIDKQKQAIGDILVSKQLLLYDLARAGSAEIIFWGYKPHASSWLLDRFHSADLYRKGAEAHFGLVLSGEKLADDVDYREQLHAFGPGAIGGEMEGAGLYTACQDRKTDWILVKGICDWTNGCKDQDKEQHQQQAARNAAGFVLHTLRQAPLRRDFVEKAGRSSLPHQPCFFGREPELAIIEDAISEQTRTWGVLIDGPCGIGKTALAVYAGHLASVEQFPLKIFLSAKARKPALTGEQPLEDFMLPNYLELLTELACELGDENLSRMLPNERARAVHHLLMDKKALIIIDNVETFAEAERMRLYQFLDCLPISCKAIVTSRWRMGIDAHIVRLDRLVFKDAQALIEELARNNRHLARAAEKEIQDLYEITRGNPLLIRWVSGQLGRRGSRCRTVADACAFIQSAPPGNDPLEFIFDDLLDTFSESETTVLTALVHFSLPAKMKWIADLVGLSEPTVETVLEHLEDRALLISDQEAQTFFLPPLTAGFLRRKRPKYVAETGNRLQDRVHALALENGFQNHKRFPVLEAEWPGIAAALPLFLQGNDKRLLTLLDALFFFLEFSGRWDEEIAFYQRAEEKAISAGDFEVAGRCAYRAGYVYSLREQANETMAYAARAQADYQKSGAGVYQQMFALDLRGLGHGLEKNDLAARKYYQDTRLCLWRTLKPKTRDVAVGLRGLGHVEQRSGDQDAAERHYRKALDIDKKLKNQAGIAHDTGALASLALARKDWSNAETLAREALSLAEIIEKQRLIADQCHLLADILGRQGRSRESLTYARRAVDIFEQLCSPDLETARTLLESCERGRRQGDAVN